MPVLAVIFADKYLFQHLLVINRVVLSCIEGLRTHAFQDISITCHLFFLTVFLYFCSIKLFIIIISFSIDSFYALYYDISKFEGSISPL